MYPYDMEGVSKIPHIQSLNDFSKKVHKYTFLKEFPCNTVSISAILMVHFGCTFGVLLVYFWKYTRNKDLKDLKIRLGVSTNAVWRNVILGEVKSLRNILEHEGEGKADKNKGFLLEKKPWLRRKEALVAVERSLGCDGKKTRF